MWRPWQLGHLCQPVVEKHTESRHRQKAKGKETAEMQIDLGRPRRSSRICCSFFWMPIFGFGPGKNNLCSSDLLPFVAHGKTTPANRAKGADAATGWSGHPWFPILTRKVVKSPVTGSFDNLIEIIHVWWQLTHIDENITGHLCSWLVHPPLVNSATCYIQHFADKVEDPTASICIVHLRLWRVLISWFGVP